MQLKLKHKDILPPDREERRKLTHAILFKGFAPTILDTDFPARVFLLECIYALEQLGINCVIEHASPFFWSNMQRIYNAINSSDSKSNSELWAASVGFIAAAFDSFFYLLAISTSFTIEFPVRREIQIACPKLQLFFNNQCNGLRLQVSNSYTPTIYQKNGNKIWEISQFKLTAKIVPIKFRDSNRDGVVIGLPYNTLFHPTEAIQIIDNINDSILFSSQLNNALNFIEEVDSSVYSSVIKSLKWYAPIKTPNSDTHSSFTSPALLGVAFLSLTNDALRLSDAIIHETGHTELNKVLLTDTLSHNEKLFYSPWRLDARPITGLFHGVYVFSRVALFLRNVIQRSMNINHSYVNHRRRIICERLNIALSQIAQGELTPLGCSILNQIKLSLDEDEIFRSVQDKKDYSDIVLKHIVEWSRLNCNLPITHLKLEESLRQCIDGAAK